MNYVTEKELCEYCAKSDIFLPCGECKYSKACNLFMKEHEYAPLFYAGVKANEYCGKEPDRKWVNE